MSATCRECGCTETNACVLYPREGTDQDVVQTCHWAEPDLCSACTPAAGNRWVHPAEQRSPA